MLSRLSLNRLFPTVTITLTLLTGAIASGQGIAVTGVGPVNRSMGGAGTAAPLDAIGSLHWNPGSISSLPSSELSFGTELLLADIDLTSSIGGLTGTTSGEAGVAIIPAVGWVHHLEDSPATIGLGVYGIGGFRNNLPADPTNPVLAAGPIFADAEIMQVAPTLSYALTERLSIGFAPTVTAARFMMDPLGPSPITPVPTPGSGNRVHWGGGFQVGMYYMTDSCWNLGLTFKSTQWFEDFRFFTPTGVTKFDIDYPMILSAGLSYTGYENWVFAFDARYFDYANTPGFSDFGWSSVFAGAVGVQYLVNECWSLRGGFNFNANPIHSDDAAANLSDPLIQQENISAGMSYRLTSNVDLTMAYIYLVNNSVSGPLPPPFAPGDSITHEINAHSLAFGVTVRY
jgi:long-chain fatty acid transport protein